MLADTILVYFFVSNGDLERDLENSGLVRRSRVLEIGDLDRRLEYSFFLSEFGYLDWFCSGENFLCR